MCDPNQLARSAPVTQWNVDGSVLNAGMCVRQRMAFFPTNVLGIVLNTHWYTHLWCAKNALPWVIPLLAWRQTHAPKRCVLMRYPWNPTRLEKFHNQLKRKLTKVGCQRLTSNKGHRSRLTWMQRKGNSTVCSSWSEFSKNDKLCQSCLRRRGGLQVTYLNFRILNDQSGIANQELPRACGQGVVRREGCNESFTIWCYKPGCFQRGWDSQPTPWPFYRDLTQYIRIDPAHTYGIDGIGKDFLASTIIMLVRMGHFGVGNVGRSLQNGYAAFMAYCNAFKKNTSIADFDFATLKIPRNSLLLM